MQGFKCGAAGGGGDSPIVKLFSITLAADTSPSINIDLSNVDMSQFAELWVETALLPTSGGGGALLALRFNGDTGKNYWQGTTTCQTGINISSGYASAGYWNLARTRLIAEEKVASFCECAAMNGSSSGVSFVIGRWIGGTMGSVKSIQIGQITGTGSISTFKAGSRVCLYGLKK